jgi:tripartite-type tricarboxylate transporter receptor subunit TctC
VSAQSFPSKPIRVIVPFGPGTATDVAIRIVTSQMAANTGATLVIENVPGGDSLIGVRRALTAEPDGYTLVGTGTTPNSIGGALFKQATFHPIDDFTQLAVLAIYPTLLVVKADSPYKTLDDLIKAAKASPGSLTLASASPSMQVKGAVFQNSTDIEMLHVPYKTSSEGLNDVVGGRVDAQVVDPASSSGLIRSGALRAIAVLAPQRTQVAPGIPTLGEAGYKDIKLDSWSGIGAPGQTPGEAKTWLVKSLNEAIKEPAIQEKLAAAGSVPLPEVPLDGWVQEQFEAWNAGVKESGLEPR